MKPSSAANTVPKAWRVKASSIAQPRRRFCPLPKSFFKGQSGILLLKIDPSLLSSELRWEPPSGGAPPPGVPEGDLFPHIYGPINLDAIVKVYDLESNPDGNYKLPSSMNPS